MPAKKSKRKPRRVPVGRGKRERKKRLAPPKPILLGTYSVAEYCIELEDGRVHCKLTAGLNSQATLEIPEVEFIKTYESAAQAMRELRKYAKSVAGAVLRLRKMHAGTKIEIDRLLTP